MNRDNETLLRKIGNNLRFVITISIFFLALFPESKFPGSFLIVGYIISYIIFEVREGSFSSRNLKWINGALLVGIASYAFPLFVIALSSQNKLMPLWQEYVFKGLTLTSILLVVTIPLITLVMVCLFSGEKTLSQRFLS